jgi:hypothetical protein
MTTVVTPRKGGKAEPAFSITFTIGADQYVVSPLPVDPSIGRKAFRFEKQTGDRAVYDLLADEHGLQCECLGFLRWGHCKHVQKTQEAGALFHIA